MKNEGTLWHWVVRYSYRRSRWDLARNILSVCFWTYAEARAWADAPHSELLDFKVESIYEEAIPQIIVHPCVPRDAHYANPQNTDDMIINHI